MFHEDYEEFTESQHKTLEKYVTNTRSHIFVLRNLPEVIKGALFSRYSRSTLGLRSLLLKEFISNAEESGFGDIAGAGADLQAAAQQTKAIQKAQTFYDRILDGYGDDSIGELGGAHVAIENVSMLAAKIIEDARIGGSPLEKSTRYIYFDQKVHGEYLFYREPVLMTSAYRELYVDICNMLFETYSKLIPPLTTLIETKMPQDPNTSKVAYTAALRAKVLDCLRGLLPAGTLTNMGVFGNGRFFEHLKTELKTIRTGRASPSMLDAIFVEVYGTSVRLRDIASITAPEPRMLLITPFDVQNNKAIGKAIEVANLGVMPIVDANVVRLKIAAMDDNVRKEMVKQCHKKREEAKVSIRNIRREANDAVRKQKADGDVSEDQVKKMEKMVQELTDKSCKEADDVSDKKEKEVSTI